MPSVLGVAASGLSGIEGDNNALTWTAQQVNVQGNGINIVLENPDAINQQLSIVVDGKLIICKLATDAGGAIISTAAQIKAAVENNPGAVALVSVDNTGNSTGAAAVSDQVIELSGGEDPVTTGIAAIGTSGAEGANNGLTWTAKQVGVVGNGINVILEDPDGNDQELSIAVHGSAIICKLATGVGGAITTTAAQLKSAIDGDTGANALVAITHTGASTGEAAVTDQIIELSGGADPIA